jgi:hypothetical protein
VAIEVATCSEVIYHGELPMLSTLPSLGPRSLSAAHWQPVLSLQVCAPLPVPYGPPAKGPVRNKENCHPGEPPRGSARSSCEAPITFSCNLRLGFEFSPSARAGPRAAVVDDEGVSLPGELFKLNFLWSSCQIFATRLMATVSPPTSRLTCQVPPMSSCCARRQSE